MPEEWIVWNQYHGTVQRTVISDLRPWKHGATGKLDGLEYDHIGRIPVDKLIAEGNVDVYGYYIMSPDYWRKNERRLRQQFARHLFADGHKSKLTSEMLLGFSEDDKFTEDDVKKAFHLAVNLVHPDKGGDASIFDAVKKARDELVKKIQTSLIDDDIPF